MADGEKMECESNGVGVHPEPALSDDRLANFYNRAVSESARMQGEFSKTMENVENLRNEIGEEGMSGWISEHTEMASANFPPVGSHQPNGERPSDDSLLSTETIAKKQ